MRELLLALADVPADQKDVNLALIVIGIIAYGGGWACVVLANPFSVVRAVLIATFSGFAGYLWAQALGSRFGYTTVIFLVLWLLGSFVMNRFSGNGRRSNS